MGVCVCSLSPAIRDSAPLSSTTTESAWFVSRLSVSTELYGCTTTSPSSALGKTEYVCINFFGNLSFNRSRTNEPKPEPVPPAIECMSMNPCSRRSAIDPRAHARHGDRNVCVPRANRSLPPPYQSSPSPLRTAFPPTHTHAPNYSPPRHRPWTRICSPDYTNSPTARSRCY